MEGLQHVVDFLIPGRPIAKGRPRFFKGRAVTPKRTREYEKFCGMCGQMAMRSAGYMQPLEGGISLQLLALFARPKSIGRKHCLYQWPHRRPLVGGGGWPDLSNLVKAVEDGLQGVVYLDDNQIWETQAARMYAGLTDQPGVHVRVCRISTTGETQNDTEH